MASSNPSLQKKHSTSHLPLVYCRGPCCPCGVSRGGISNRCLRAHTRQDGCSGSRSAPRAHRSRPSPLDSYCSIGITCSRVSQSPAYFDLCVATRAAIERSSNLDDWPHAARVPLRRRPCACPHLTAPHVPRQNVLIAVAALLWPIQLCPLCLSPPDPLRPARSGAIGVGSDTSRIAVTQKAVFHAICDDILSRLSLDQLASVREAVLQVQALFSLPIERHRGSLSSNGDGSRLHAAAGRELRLANQRSAWSHAIPDEPKPSKPCRRFLGQPQVPRVRDSGSERVRSDVAERARRKLSEPYSRLSLRTGTPSLSEV